MRSIGTLADVAGNRKTQPETDPYLEIESLKRRVSTLENLLADVMMQLDKPYQNRNQPGTRASVETHPHPSEIKQKPKPKGKAQPPSQTPKVTSNHKADIEAAITFLEKHPDRLWHGRKLRQAIKDTCEISNARLKIVIDELRKNGKLTIVNNVEVDGEMLKGAYQYTP